MLPKPDLFLSVCTHNTDSSLHNQSTRSEVAAEYENCCVKNNTCSSEVECLNDVCESKNSELTKHPYTVGVSRVHLYVPGKPDAETSKIPEASQSEYSYSTACLVKCMNADNACAFFNLSTFFLSQIRVMLATTTPAQQGSACLVVLVLSSPSGVRPHAGHALLAPPQMVRGQKALPSVNIQSAFIALPQAWPYWSHQTSRHCSLPIKAATGRCTLGRRAACSSSFHPSPCLLTAHTLSLSGRQPPKEQKKCSPPAPPHPHQSSSHQMEEDSGWTLPLEREISLLEGFSFHFYLYRMTSATLWMLLLDKDQAIRWTESGNGLGEIIGKRKSWSTIW
jgi:hypothetical protein